MKELKYDYLIFGSGLFGALFAYKAKTAGKRFLVIDKRNHAGENVFCEHISRDNVHSYGAHILHTDNKRIWDYINQFASFNHYINSPLACSDNKIYNLPFNMNTFYQL